ncbi:hypothetical protein ABTZ59_12465 [Streptomyces sp. NPDC094034]|uniref:hypothetical protein n=1 Tax=Streptomyces sp. NPDC094034 TaxID=3155309 RepID=UPI003332DF2C
MPRKPDTGRRNAMRRGGLGALEAVGMVITALAAQTVIRGLLDQDSELLWGVFNWVPGGPVGRLILLGVIALVAMVSGGWAHTRRARDAERASDPGAFRG